MIFCRCYDDILALYQTAALELHSRGALYSEGLNRKSQNRLCDKYDACTALSVKKNIISSFTQRDGILRVAFATTAFAMGLDSPNICYIIHKPPNDIEEYVQENGRGGRDGKSAVAVLYYARENQLSQHLSVDMKWYIINSKSCRQDKLMGSFGDSSRAVKPAELHLCCDICAQKCSCGNCTHMIDSVQLESATLRLLNLLLAYLQLTKHLY